MALEIVNSQRFYKAVCQHISIINSPDFDLSIG